MNRWTIYSINGVAKYVSENLEYHDIWMGEEYVSVTVSSPTPIYFEIGDFLEYRGHVYSIYNIPSALKSARKSSYGEAFKYENVKFSARSTELAEIRFHDIVLGDNEMHYTSLADFSCYCETVDDLVDRLQANTNRDETRQWYFITPSKKRTLQRYEGDETKQNEALRLWNEAFGSTGDTENKGKDNVNISVNNVSVWDGLSYIKQYFGLNYVTKDRVVVVGGDGIPTSKLFKYGKGNGLYQIERVADSEQQVVTKLFSYGSKKNLPIRYYANLNMMVYVTVTRIISTSPLIYAIVDLPFSEKYFTNKNESTGEEQYIVTATNLNGAEYAHCTVSGIGPYEHTAEEADKCLFVLNWDYPLAVGDRIYLTAGVNKDKFPPSHQDYATENLPNNMAINTLMLPGFPTYSLAELCRCVVSNGKTNIEIRKSPEDEYKTLMTIDGERNLTFSNDKLRPYIVSDNADVIGIKEGDIHFTEENDDNGLKEIYPSIEGMTQGDVFGTDSADRLDEILLADTISDNGVYAEGADVQNFNITLKDLGFDLKTAFANGGDSMVISLKDGYCGGRDFSVKSVAGNDNGTWKLNVERQHDEALDLWYPYSDSVAHGGSSSSNEPYQIQTGDHFVLTNIELEDTNYVWAASIKLLRKSITWLLNNDYTRFTYLPKIDDIYMARQHDEAITTGTTSLHDTLKAGMLFNFKDLDLEIDGQIYIDNLTIKENGNSGIPTYGVTLREDKQVGSLQRIQNQINSLVNGGGVGGNGGGLSMTQVRGEIEAYGSESFLSKVSDDTAQGEIGFLKGLWIKTKGVFGFDADGNGSLNSLTLKDELRALAGYFTSLVSNSLQSSNYTGDGIADTGFRLTSDDGTGSSALTIDNLHIRKKLTAEELEVKKETAIAGNQIHSCAANVINRTDYYDEYGNLLGYSYRQVPWLLKKIPFLLRGIFLGRLRNVRIELSPKDAARIDRIRCYFLAKDDDTEVVNMWRVGDLARCQSINIANTTRSLYINGQPSISRNVYWWRKVVAAADTDGYGKVTIDDQEYHYFDVSMNDCDAGSDIPAAGDHVVQFGNDHDPNRMNVMATEVNSVDAPAAKDYEGIYTFDLNKNWWQQGQADESPMVYRRSPRAGVKIVSSKFELITKYSVAPVPIERGAWVSGMVYFYYELVQHKGASWLCVASTGNRYQALEDISAQIPAGTILTQAQYDTLSVEDKIKCTRTATGSTTLEPSEQNVAVWRPYAQKGATGQSAFKSTMFCRMTNTPAKPTHGSYVNPSPADPAGTDADGEVITWSDGIPDGVKQLWASTRIFTSDGQAPQQSEWNDSRKMTDTETYDVEFAMKQTNDAKPAEPNGHNQHGGDQPQVWYDPTLDSSVDFTQMYWRAERTIINGVPGSWVIVRIKGEKGDKGTSIKSVTSFYAKTNRALVMPRDDQEVTWEESLSALGEITEGWYVWTKNITSYSDTLENTTTYTVSKWGIDGDGIENIETKFYEDSQLLEQEELAALAENKWKEYNQLDHRKGDYIYTRTRITYKKGDTPTVSYMVNRIGQDGVGYVGTEEYYVLGNSQTNVPSGHPYTGSDPYKKYTAAEWQQIQITGGWSESRPTYQGDANKYIWNFEVSFDTDDNAMVTKPICIGDYSKGISTIVETYTISSHPTKAAMLADTAERTAHPWVDEVQDSAPTDELPYQWNKTVTSYSDGTSDTFYHVSAVKGTRGRGITNTNIYYKADSSTPATPSGAPSETGWSDDGNTLITKANSDANKHLYESTCTTYSDGTYTWTTPIDDGLISDMAATSEEFALADSGTTAPTSGWRTSVTPTAGKWVWSRTKLTFKTGTPLYKYINTQCVGYCGTDGKSITKSSEVREYQTSSSGTTIPTGTWLPENQKPTPAQGDYLWTRTTIRWSDTSTTVLYSAERNPNDGQAGQSIVVDSTEFKYSVQNSNTIDPTTITDWSDYNAQTHGVKDKWLWSRTTVTYKKSVDNTSAGSSVTYNCVFNAKNGTNGRAISAQSEHYNVSNSDSTQWNVPSSGTWANEWTTDPNVPDQQGNTQWGENNIYLWNYEKTTYTESDGSTTIARTTPHIVAIWTKDGDNGKGIDSIVNYYQVGATEPSLPANIDTANPTLTGWSTNPSNPPAGQYLWNFERIIWLESDGTYSYTHTSVHSAGYTGNVGQSTFKSIVFKRTNTTPVSAPSGGSYSSPVPSGWSDGVPEGNEQLWCSTRIFTSDGQSPQQASWTTPRLMTDTADFDVEYSTVESNPGNPTSNPSNWSDAASSNTIWMATRECHNGTWSTWQVFKVKGEKPVAGEDYPIPQNGNDAYSVTIEPADMLFTQSTTKNAQGVYPLVDATKEATVIVKKGNSNNAVEHTISIGTYSGCNTPTMSGDTIIVEGKIGNYTEGYVNIQVDIANGPTFNLKLNLYYNLLGTWKRDVEDGTETVIAEKLSYKIFDDGVHSIEDTGQYVRGWGDNTSILTKQVSGDNLFIGLDKSGSNCGWFSRAFGNSISYTPSSGLLQTSSRSPYEMISPLVYLVVGREYCVSAYFVQVQDKFDRDDNIKLYTRDRTEYASITTVENDKTTGETMSYDQATWTRRYIRLKVNNTGWYHISFYQINGLLYPQFEFSEYPTKFNVGGTTTQSMIKQTADEIEAKVNDTGVNIQDKRIDLFADKVRFYKSKAKVTPGDAAKIWIDGDKGSLHAVDGEFEGLVKTIREGKGAWEISPSVNEAFSSPVITGYDKNNNRVLYMIFDGDPDDPITIDKGGGLYFTNGTEGDISHYLREGWRVKCPDYNRMDEDGKADAITAVPGTRLVREPQIVVSSNYKKFGASGNYAAIKMSINTSVGGGGACIYSNDWKTKSYAAPGETYVDDFGNLKVKGTSSYDQINYRFNKSSCQLPAEVPAGTIFFVKLTDDGRVYSTLPIMKSHDRELWSYSDGYYSENIYQESHFFVFSGTYWIDYHCSAQ